MSARNNNGRQNRRPRRGRGRRINPKTSLVKQPNNPFPASMTVNMRYSDYLNIVNTSGAYNFNTYRMNSTFDPDFSAGGHQPLGRDQLILLYTKYRVNEFSWNIHALPEGSAISTVAVHPTAASGSPGSTEAQSEFPWGSQQITTASASPLRFRGRLPLRQFLGQSRANFEADDSNESINSTNPAANAYFVVGSQSTNLSSTNTVRCVIELTYNVTWFAPQALSQS